MDKRLLAAILLICRLAIGERQFYDESIPGLGIEDTEDDFYSYTDEGYFVGAWEEGDDD